VSEQSFGERIRRSTVAEVLALERNYPPAMRFAPLDDLLSRVCRSSLDGTRIAVMHDAVKPHETVQLLTINDTDHAYIGETFDISTQQSRGAWFLADEANLNAGFANLPYHFGRLERFATGIVHAERGKVPFQASPEALFFWSVLDPFFELLYRPFELRGLTSPGRDRDDQRKAWEELERAYCTIGLAASEELAGMRFGSGWSKLHLAEQLAAKRALLAALRGSAPSDIGTRYRVWVTTELLSKYYTKAFRGTPSMRKVMTKPLQRTLSGFFGGDWLAFLSYIGETPSPDEQISTVLPETRLYVGDASRAKAVAARHGVPAEEVERMLAAFWTSGDDESPIHQRIRVMREYWEHFDRVHSEQAPGMQSLWGFADDAGLRLNGLDNSQNGPSWYRPGQHRTALPTSLLANIARLWGGLFMPTTPDCVVTAVAPYRGMLDSFGPALRFWDGVGLTAWFVSEGPMSRTDMAGLEKYHERDLHALSTLGAPVNTGMFAELIVAEGQLGKPEPITDPAHSSSAGADGIRISITMNFGSRRAGFERLRDIVTAHRRAWSTRFLDTYLRARWENEIRSAAREYNRHIEVKRKPPTAKQFAKIAEGPTNHWFGGDVSLLYAAFGEKSPIATRRVSLLPPDVESFALRVFYALGGKNTTQVSDRTHDGDVDEQERRQAEWTAHWQRKGLAEASPRYVQLREGLGRQPTITEFGRSKFEYLGAVLDDNATQAWETYASTIDSLLAPLRD
jgi:hypothetical protein